MHLPVVVSAQISIYPLRQAHLSPAVDAVWQALKGQGLQPDVGPMSTVVTGEVAVVFAALQEAYGRAAAAGHVVMAVTISNACPV
ncbi:MAG TPA: YkoF family thiamine/hydroxymethylpyrimidine-binding protein [Candidatus Margulisiibacteriota bacterium]|nr:YkoF family thiamine/hydroxymethylpyrimidine-binding protein [Candidatus Margulisiibacteriota bacterium]